MNIFAEYKECIVKIVEEIIDAQIDTSRVTVEAPRESSHGDMATNAAMVLSKSAGMNPRELAAKIAQKLELEPAVKSVDIAGPGFINMRLENDAWTKLLAQILELGEDYGQTSFGKGHHVNVEYVSANPTGPLHVGHTRGSVVGDVLCNLLEKAGYGVTREYYINDAGAQIDTLARSAHLRYREALGEDIGEIPEGLYPGAYLKETGQALAEEYGDQYLDADETAYLPVFKSFCVQKMMEMIRQDLGLLGIQHDVFTSEKELTKAGKVEQAVAVLEEQGLVYQGTLPPPKGKEADWDPVELTLFKSTQFGDDEDRALKKPDGSWTYTTPDIAYHWDKYKRGSDILITVVGMDHIGWVKRITAGTAAVTKGKADFKPMLCDIVNMLKDGKPFKLSKRAGNIITMRDVIEEVGADVLRFIMLTRKNDQTLDFDFSVVTTQSKDNPVFYVQYAHARCCSVLRSAGQNIDCASVDFSLLEAEAELNMIKSLALWPRMVDSAAEAREPHRIAFYLQDVAAAFHSWWNTGNMNKELRFLIEGKPELSLARLALVQATAHVIASALQVMGVTPAQELRSEELERDIA